MYTKIKEKLTDIKRLSITAHRKESLHPLVTYITECAKDSRQINLNFICTHNSRRSHLSQIWMQVCAAQFELDSVHTYSGGTEATAMFSVVKSTLEKQGFRFVTLAIGNNPIYGIRYAEDRLPIIAFSKNYDNEFNPSENFAAIMTCDHADENCPLIIGAEKRIPITYLDPKVSDDTDQQLEVYLERSNQIASEMYYVMEQVSKKLKED